VLFRSRAIFSHLQRTAIDPATAHVWLDLRPIPEEKIRRRFPNIIQVCQHWGIDLFREPIPVAPAAHYWMGGIATDIQNRTSIPGLYALGETASTGVHGANRLASNSLLECVVFGAEMNAIALSWQECPLVELPPISCRLSPEEVTQIHWWRQELPRLVWQSAGICREQGVLEGAIAQVDLWRQEFANLRLSQSLLNLVPPQVVNLDFADASGQLKVWAETRNLLDISSLILKSSAFRTESRGGHYRLDYPQPDPSWQVHTLVQNDRLWKSPPLAGE
jgi:L-aspartate oxidase